MFQLKSRQVRVAHADSRTALDLHRACRAACFVRLRALLTCACVAASSLHCGAMLHACRAPVRYRGARVSGDCVKRHVVNCVVAPVRAGQLQPALGFRCALRRCSVVVPAPHLARRARRESLSGAALRLRSRGKRAEEVRFALYLSVLSSHGGLSLRQAPPAGAPITVWVRRMDVADAQFVAVKDVDALQTVSKFKARWLAQAKLDVDPSLVTLRLVKRGTGKPTPKQETNAKELDDPSLSLAEAKVADSAWLLANVVGSGNERLSTSGDAPGAYMLRVPLHPLMRAYSRVHTRTAFTVLAEEAWKVKMAAEEVKMALNSTGKLLLSTHTLAELYRGVMSMQRLQLVQLPTRFAPDPAASARAWTRLPPGTAEEKVKEEFELCVLPLAAASRKPTLVLLGSTSPTIGTRKPHVVGYVAAPLAPELVDAQPLSRFIVHIACAGSLKPRREAGNEGKFSDDEKGGALSLADALVRKQPWRAFHRLMVHTSCSSNAHFGSRCALRRCTWKRWRCWSVPRCHLTVKVVHTWQALLWRL